MLHKPSRFLRVLGLAGLLIGLLAATMAPAVAQTDDNGGNDSVVEIARSFEAFFDFEDPGFLSGDNAIFYPWVANDDDFGLGPADTSISVQNLEARDAQIFIYVGAGDGGFRLETTAFLSAYAAKTFSAGDLGLAEGEGAPVVVAGFTLTGAGDLPIIVDAVETTVILSKPVGVEGDFTQVLACVVNEMLTDDFGAPLGFTATTAGPGFVEGDFVAFETQQDLQDILNTVNAGNTGALINPFGGLNNDADCLDAFDMNIGGSGSELDSVALGGVAKQAVDGERLPATSAADTAVSGYNAVNGLELAQFDEWYLPVVQTNCGPGGCWDSVIRVANLNNLNTAVTIRFFPADDGSGSLQTGFQVQESIDGGDTVSINLSDLVPEGWVGSAHIFSDGTVFAMVDRYKVGYNMWITNTGSSADFENTAQIEGSNGRFALFAPHVLIDYYGWNTGINVANLSDQENNVSIQYFNLFGNATEGLNQRLAPQGMTYFYDPSQAPQDGNGQDVTTDVNAGVVGSAIIWSDFPVAAVVDATKYPESDPNGGLDVFQATSYSATQNIFTWQAVPLVQKGNATDGMGDTSGINIMNPNPSAVTANVYYVNPSGFNAQNFGTSSVTIPGFANGFVYTLTQRNLPNGFTGAAQVVASQPVAAVSANVNYQVDGDGSAIFNAFNPCGFFRVAENCTFGDPFDTSGRSVTKTFVDEFGNPVQGVGFSIETIDGSTDFAFQRDGFSGSNGSLTFENVPVGNYELFVTTLPAGFAAIDPTVAQDTFTVNQGEDVVLENILDFGQGFTKTVIVTGSGGDLTTGVTLEDVNITVYENIGADGSGAPVAGDVVFTGLTDASGITSSPLPAGSYILCISDANESAITSNGETVIPDLSIDGGFGLADCEEFEVVAGIVTGLENEVDILAGTLNVFVFETSLSDTGGVETQTGVAGVDVCAGVECVVTDANGFARFEDVSNGGITISVQGDENTVVNAFGGDLTVDVSSVTEDGLAGTPATIVVAYSPTEDIAQDGFLDDVDAGTVVGSFDLNVDLGGASDVVITTQLEGAPFDGAIVTLHAMVGDGTLCEDGAGAVIDSDVSVDGGVTFSGVADGTYCVAVDFDGDGIDEQVQTVIVDADGTATATFNLTTGQIDILNVGTTANRPSEDTEFCLDQLVSTGVYDEIGCVFVPQGGFVSEDAYFYADVTSGTYRIRRFDANGVLRDTSNDANYSVTLDLDDGFLADVENSTNAPVGRGVIRTGGSEDFTQLVNQFTSTQP